MQYNIIKIHKYQWPKFSKCALAIDDIFIYDHFNTRFTFIIIFKNNTTNKAQIKRNLIACQIAIAT